MTRAGPPRPPFRRPTTAWPLSRSPEQDRKSRSPDRSVLGPVGVAEILLPAIDLQALSTLSHIGGRDATAECSQRLSPDGNAGNYPRSSNGSTTSLAGAANGPSSSSTPPRPARPARGWIRTRTRTPTPAPRRRVRQPGPGTLGHRARRRVLAPARSWPTTGTLARLRTRMPLGHQPKALVCRRRDNSTTTPKDCRCRVRHVRRCRICRHGWRARAWGPECPPR